MPACLGDRLYKKTILTRFCPIMDGSRKVSVILRLTLCRSRWRRYHLSWLNTFKQIDSIRSKVLSLNIFQLFVWKWISNEYAKIHQTRQFFTKFRSKISLKFYELFATVKCYRHHLSWLNIFKQLLFDSKYGRKVNFQLFVWKMHKKRLWLKRSSFNLNTTETFLEPLWDRIWLQSFFGRVDLSNMRA